MGAHRIENDHAIEGIDVARLVGRGAVATSAALALAGSGAGLALATPGDDDGDGSGGDVSSHGAGHDSHDSGPRSATVCDPGDDGLVDGLLGDLGLGGGDRQAPCDTGSEAGSQGDSSGSDGSSGASSGTPSDGTSDGGTSSGGTSSGGTSSGGTSSGGTQQAQSSAQRSAQSDPVNEPPEFGETTTLPIPAS